jgi:hypothetical protein
VVSSNGRHAPAQRFRANRTKKSRLSREKLLELFRLFSWRVAAMDLEIIKGEKAAPRRPAVHSAKVDLEVILEQHRDWVKSN